MSVFDLLNYPPPPEGMSEHLVFRPVNPVYHPRYHTVESYRSQQRRARRRRKRRLHHH